MKSHQQCFSLKKNICIHCTEAYTTGTSNIYWFSTFRAVWQPNRLLSESHSFTFTFLYNSFLLVIFFILLRSTTTYSRYVSQLLFHHQLQQFSRLQLHQLHQPCRCCCERHLCLPLSILVFYLGYQRWLRQRSFKTTSHSDIFTYHMAAMDLFWVLGCICFYCGTYANLPEMMMIGVHTSAGFFYGATLFHLLTCVERYLAVVHPIIYMKLKNVCGVWIRNISIGCAWLLCFGYMGISALYLPSYPIIPLPNCPGPRKEEMKRSPWTKQKQRAFHTIRAITGALWLWFGALLISIALDNSSLLSHSVRCLVISSVGWFNLPCYLVRPLLYLHRAEKSFCCYNNE